MKARLVLICVVVLVVLGGLSLYALAPAEERLEYRFGTVESGDIESVVASSGTLRALNTVIVGSQLSGQVAELHADFNDSVTAGDLIARIDPRTFQARVQQNRADVAMGMANIESRRAELVRAGATLGQARRELERRRTLMANGHVSASELDRDVTLVETSGAQVAIARAAITNADANLEQRKAALAQAELDLERTYIRSPVSGTVINRQIEIGQTVAATFAAPVLFEIGQDLHRMQVEASVDEADIGRIREGMPCRFTVDAYPDRQFLGRIEQVRKAPDLLQNVVTYKVIVTADNDDLALLPGMTANVEMILGSKSDVLKVPNAALRFAPRGTRAEESAAGQTAGFPMPGGGFRPGGTGPGPGGFGPGGRGGGTLAAVREQFDLTPEQSARLDEIADRQRAAMRDAFQAADGEREVMRARMQSVRAGLRDELASVLAPGQLRAFDALQSGRAARRRATVWMLDEDGEPASRRVVVGLADDAATEVIEGLREGERVIVRATRRPG